MEEVGAMAIEKTQTRIIIERMVRAYAELKPWISQNPYMRWEMTKEQAELIATEFMVSKMFSTWGPIQWKQWIEDNKEEITFLGIKVNIVEQSGIRLVFVVI